MYSHGNITLRKLEASNLYQLVDLKEESWLTTHQASILNRQDQTRWFEQLDNNPNYPKNLVLEAHWVNGNQDNVFGIFKVFNIDYISRTADTGWDVFRSFRGKGCGKKLVAAGTAFCFDVLALRRLNAEILVGNEASLKCALAAGFVQEGCKRQAVHKLGQHVDSLVFGMLVSEWTGRGVGCPTPKEMIYTQPPL